VMSRLKSSRRSISDSWRGNTGRKRHLRFPVKRMGVWGGRGRIWSGVVGGSVLRRRADVFSAGEEDAGQTIRADGNGG